MNEPTRSRPGSLWILIFLLVFLGLNAAVAGGTFIVAPDGHLIQMPLSNLKNSPFSNFLVPGILLFLFVGLFPLLLGYSLWRLPAWKWPDTINPFKRMHWSWAGSLAAGAATMIWIIIQIQWLTVSFLHVLVFGWGALILVVTLLPGVRRYCARKS
jgi:hypothetical protein